jgi:hypothetical protein
LTIVLIKVKFYKQIDRFGSWLLRAAIQMETVFSLLQYAIFFQEHQTISIKLSSQDKLATTQTVSKRSWKGVQLNLCRDAVCRRDGG